MQLLGGIVFFLAVFLIGQSSISDVISNLSYTGDLIFLSAVVVSATSIIMLLSIFAYKNKYFKNLFSSDPIAKNHKKGFKDFALDLKRDNNMTFTLVVLPSFLFVSTLFAQKISLDNQAETFFGQISGIYMDAQGGVYEKKVYQTESDTALSEDVSLEKKEISKYVYLGQLNCKKSLMECNHILVKNKAKIVSQLIKEQQFVMSK